MTPDDMTLKVMYRHPGMPISASQDADEMIVSAGQALAGVAPSLCIKGSSPPTDRWGRPAVLAQALRSSGLPGYASLRNIRDPGLTTSAVRRGWGALCFCGHCDPAHFNCRLLAGVLWLMSHQQVVVARWRFPSTRTGRGRQATCASNRPSNRSRKGGCPCMEHWRADQHARRRRCQQRPFSLMMANRLGLRHE